MMENDYCSLIILLFGRDNFIKEITEVLAFYYPITTQECMLSVSCEKISSKVSKNSSSTQKLKSNEYISSVECDKSSSNVPSHLKYSSSAPKSKSNKCTSSLEYDKSPSNVPNNFKKTLL